MADMVLHPQMSLKEKLKIADEISNSVNKKYKKVIVGRIGNNPEIEEKLKIRFYPTPSENLNAAMGGGWPRGRESLVAGMPDSGKTSILLESIAHNQELDPTFVALWVESEHSLDKNYACNVFKIDPERFIFLEHTREAAGEGTLDVVESYIASGAVNMVCINSLKCLVPSEEFGKDMKAATVGTQARMNSKMVRKFTAIIAENDVAFIIVEHLTADIGKFMGDPNTIAGGNAIRYASAMTLDFRKHMIQETDPIKADEGVKIGVSVKKNHCVPDRNPYVKTEYYALFGKGIDKYLEITDNAIKKGIVIQNGAYIKELDAEGKVKLDKDGNKMQWCGKAAFKKYCEEHEDYFEYISNKVTSNVTEMNDLEVADALLRQKLIEDSIKDGKDAKENKDDKNVPDKKVSKSKDKK